MTIRALRIVLCICAAWCTGPVTAQELPPVVLAALQHAHVPADALGIYVQQVGAPQTVPHPAPLLQWQSGQPMAPASTMKLLTSYAALDLLGPAYTWKTPVLFTGQVQGDVLQGDLILQGSGDPQLVLERFWLLLRQIRAAGIRVIHGNLMIDNSWMAPQQFDAAAFDGDPTRPYNVGADALLVNFNVLDLTLHPDALPGTQLHVDTRSPTGLRSAAAVTLKDGACGDWHSGLQAQFSMIDQQIMLNLSGSYPRSCGDRVWTVQPYPLTSADYDGALFRGLWRELGGELDGTVMVAPTPVQAQLLTTYESAPLAEVLCAMNKYSNNVMSRLLWLTIGREGSQVPASETLAAARIGTWLTGSGFATDGMQLENGSGLSRTERITAWQMAQLLERAYAGALMPEFMASLPLLGVDGTLQKRAAGLTVAGHAHLKSGSLTGVRNLAGYVHSASGHSYVVVWFVNHPNAQFSDAAADLMMQWIYEHG